MRRAAPLAIALLLFADAAPGQQAPQPTPGGVAATPHSRLPGVADVPTGSGTLRGRIVHTTRPEAVAGLPIVLYALPADREPGLRGGVAGENGEFVFENVSSDPSTPYLVGVSFADIPFGTRVSFAAGESERRIEVRVSDPDSDTSAAAAGEVRLRFERGCDGLQVFESYEVGNPGERVIAVPPAERESRAPVFETRLPEQAIGFGAGPGSQGGLERDGGRVRYWGPVYPGSQVVEFGYALPAAGGRVELRRAFPAGARRVVLLTHPDGPVVRSDALRAGEPLAEDGRSWRTALAQDLAPGAELAFSLELPPAPPPADALSLASARLTLELDDAALQVDQMLELENADAGSLVAASDAPLLCVPLLEGAEELRFSTPALAMGLSRDPGGGLAVRGPLPAGRSRLSLRYLLPTGGEAASLPLRFPLDVPLLAVWVADTGVVAESERMHRRRPLLTEDRTYMHLEAFQVAAGETVELRLTPLAAARRTTRPAAAAFVTIAAAGALAFLAAPLRGRRRGDEQAPASAAALERESVYAALLDLDHDYETGKLADDDYQSFRRDLRGRALELLREERREQQPPEAGPAPGACPKCAARGAPDARFCSQCGAPLERVPAAGNDAA